MTPKQKVGCVFGIIRMLVVQPIWYFLLYKLLQFVEATDIMWFLYWIYLPVGLLLILLEVIVSSIFEEQK